MNENFPILILIVLLYLLFTFYLENKKLKVENKTLRENKYLNSLAYQALHVVNHSIPSLSNKFSAINTHLTTLLQTSLSTKSITEISDMVLNKVSFIEDKYKARLKENPGFLGSESELNSFFASSSEYLYFFDSEAVTSDKHLLNISAGALEVLAAEFHSFEKKFREDLETQIGELRDSGSVINKELSLFVMNKDISKESVSMFSRYSKAVLLIRSIESFQEEIELRSSDSLFLDIINFSISTRIIYRNLERYNESLND